MDAKGLMSDPCDRRIIRCNNCMQLLACVCQILSIFCGELRELAQLIRCVADITYCTIQACFAAQINFEVKDGSMAGLAPSKQVMMDGPVVVQTTTVVQGQPGPGQPVYVNNGQQMPPQYGQQPMQGYPAQTGQPMYAQQPMQYQQQPMQGQMYQQQPMQGQPMYGQPVYVSQQPQAGQAYMR